MDALLDIAYVLVCTFGWLIFPIGLDALDRRNNQG